MKSYANMGEFAKEYNIPLANIQATFEDYNALAGKQEKDPTGRLRAFFEHEIGGE